MARFDAIVIGTGQAGPPLAARLAAAGRTVAVVERKRFGGTCVNNGCIPTKAMVASARAAQVARTAGELGVLVGGVAVDMKRVKARKDAIVRATSEGIESWLRGLAGVTVLRGHARFVAPRRIAVDGVEHEAGEVFINVGGRALIPSLPGLAEVPHLDNSSMMEVDFLPPHLVVLGGSYVGLEFAQMFRRFGSRVTVVEQGPRLASREDDDVSDEIRAILEAEGIAVRTAATAERVARDGDGVALALAGGEVVRGSHLLVAVGRVPNTGDLGLDRAGVAVDRRGYITVDERLATSADGVWALGDCNGRGAFTHTSYNDYEVVAANLLDGGDRKVSDRIPAYALFIDPPLGRCGMGEREARASGRRVLAGKVAMERVTRATDRGETRGFFKVLVDGDSREILGAALLGIEGDELVHAVADVMYAKAPYTLFARAMHIHPTVAEILPTLFAELTPLA